VCSDADARGNTDRDPVDVVAKRKSDILRYTSMVYGRIVCDPDMSDQTIETDYRISACQQILQVALLSQRGRALLSVTSIQNVERSLLLLVTYYIFITAYN